MPGEALIVSAIWLVWLCVLPCCSPAFFLADPVFFLAEARRLAIVTGWLSRLTAELF
jgi:hypothetical protein